MKSFIQTIITTGLLFSIWTPAHGQDARILEAALGVIDQPAEGASTASTFNGAYNGLIYDSVATLPAASGYFNLRVSRRGQLTGKMRLGQSGNLRLRGNVDSNGVGNAMVAFKTVADGFDIRIPVGMAYLNVDTTDLSVHGCVRFDYDVRTFWLEGVQAAYSVESPAPQTGRYTVIFPGGGGKAGIPDGDGVATVKVSRSGRVRMAGTLADGTKTSQTAMLSAAGEWPLYVPLRSDNGALVAWAGFTNLPDKDLGGQFHWTKPPQQDAAYYPAGFIHDASLVGSRYTRPASGVPVLDISEATLVLSGGALQSDLIENLEMGMKNKLVGQNDSRTKLTIKTSTGLFTGKVVDASTGNIIPVRGAVLQKQNLGAGYFLGEGLSGQALFGAP